MDDNSIPHIEGRAFVTVDKKPVAFADYQAWREKPSMSESSLAVIMQGALARANQFTLETVRLYKQNFPLASLIVSTWDTENEADLRALEDAGAIVVTSPPPTTPCFCFMNHQIRSTWAGIEKACQLGAKYALKTRTDQRYYETGISAFCFNLLSSFPLAPHVTGQKARLVSLGFNTFKYRLYDVSDMFLFGTIEDVKLFWDCPFEERAEFPSFVTLREYCKLRPSEIFFVTHFLEKMGCEPKYTLADSWRVYAERFCIVDEHSLGFYWPKYSNATFRWRNFWGEYPELEELTFKEWLALLHGKQPEAWQEALLDAGRPSLIGRLKETLGRIALLRNLWRGAKKLLT